MVDTVSLASSGTQAPHTGNTTETVLATYTLPANTLPANGVLSIIPMFSKSGTAGNVILRVRFGGTSGTQYLNVAAAAGTTVAGSGPVRIYANNATNAQKGFPASNIAGSGASTAAMVTSSVDTTNNVDIVITAQLGNAADTINLEGYTIEMMQ